MLRRLAIHQMGCVSMPGELVRSLEPERYNLTFQKSWGQAPQQAQQEEESYVRT
jgi:hypothetical protein